MTVQELRDEVEGHALFLEAAGAVAGCLRGRRPAVQRKAFDMLREALVRTSAGAGALVAAVEIKGAGDE